MPYTVAARDDALDAANATITHAQLHTGDPGGSGTSNVAAGVDRVAIALPGSATAESEDEITFAIPGAGGPFSHFSLWTASTSGTFVTSGTITPAESFAGAGDLVVTVQTTAT
jgi:hypothetical protein